jgi:Tfp pilus assembly protein PilV
VNPQDPLAALHPLRQPEPIGWWPLAPGWWLLIALLILALGALAYVLVRRYRANAYRRMALTQLDQLRRQYLRNRDDAAYLAGANALLKSVALRAYPRREVAPCSGNTWLEFLNQSCDTAQFPPDFVTAAYCRQCPDMDMENIHQCAANWIKGHEAKV